MVLTRVDEKEEIGVALVRPHPGSIQSHFRCGRADVNGVHKLLVNLNNVDQCLPTIRCGGRVLVLVSRDIELNICGAASSCGLSDCGTVLGKNRDRKSTRLNSSHSQISYAVFCLKKKKQTSNRLDHVVKLAV